MVFSLISEERCQSPDPGQGAGFTAGGLITKGSASTSTFKDFIISTDMMVFWHLGPCKPKETMKSGTDIMTKKEKYDHYINNNIYLNSIT